MSDSSAGFALPGKSCAAGTGTEGGRAELTGAGVAVGAATARPAQTNTDGHGQTRTSRTARADSLFDPFGDSRDLDGQVVGEEAKGGVAWRAVGAVGDLGDPR